MSSKKTGKKHTTRATTSTQAAAAQTAPIDDEPFGGVDMDDDGTPGTAPAQVVDPMDEENYEPEEVDATDEVPDADEPDEDAEPAPVSEKTATRLAKAMRDPKRAAKRLRNAVARLDKFNWEALGVPGITGALALLRNAIPQLDAKQAPRQTKLSEGDKVQVREKFRGKYTDFFAEEDLVNLTVKKLANRTAKCTTAKGAEVLLPVAALEAQP